MIRVVVGGLAEQSAEGIVRPVRSDLAPVNAVSRDVGLAAGAELAERLQRIGVLPVGGAVLTPAGALPAGFIIHVVVMSEEEPQSDHTVRRALRNGLSRAADWGLQSLALPPLGLGAGTVEPEDAARGFVEVLLDHLDGGVPPLDLTVVAPSAYEASLLERLVAEATRARSSTRN